MSEAALEVNIFFFDPEFFPVLSVALSKKERFLYTLMQCFHSFSFSIPCIRIYMTSSESPFPQSSADEKAPKTETLSEPYKLFLSQLETMQTPEEKIAHGLQFMRGAISQEGTPRFREFWEARRHLLQFFKQNLNPAIRSKLWDEYVELTVEARRLKEILEEQSAFAMEQIDLAIKAIEQDVQNLDALVEKSEIVEIPGDVKTVARKAEKYAAIQTELNLLTTLASRLSALRKEIIKTEMRIRYKTRFFKRLSELGDLVFPRRKRLIEQISEEFQKDVDRFIEEHFKGDEAVGAPYYALREEIKALQGLAKFLTLNTPAFTSTRARLSECWDKVKVLEKAHKQEFQQKRQEWAENRAPIEAMIEELKTKSVDMDLKAVDEVLSEIQGKIRETELSKDDLRQLRSAMSQVRAPFLEQQEQKRKEQERQEFQKLQAKKEKTAALKEQIAQLTKDSQHSVDELQSKLDELRSEMEQLSLSKFEQQQFDRQLRPLKDLIVERKESALLNLSADDLHALEQLRKVLTQRKERRQEIKEQIETCRKSLASSGLDFEKAMLYREQMDQEKERLEKANASIVEIEAKISEIEEKA